MKFKAVKSAKAHYPRKIKFMPLLVGLSFGLVFAGQSGATIKHNVKKVVSQKIVEPDLGGGIPPIEPIYLPIPNLDKYMLSDFHLGNSHVKYFDIKWYYFNPKKRRYTYGGGWAFDMPAYEKLSNLEKKKIRSSFPKANQKGFVIRPSKNGKTASYFIQYIDSLSRVHIIDTRIKLERFLGKIDTQAEKDVMWLLRIR